MSDNPFVDGLSLVPVQKRKKGGRKPLPAPIGVKFGRLTVIAEAEPGIRPNGKLGRRVACSCDCGGAVTVELCNVKNGHTNSCGCFNSERLKQRSTTHGQSKNGRSVNYITWMNIKGRCVTGTCSKSEHYLGRGIKMYAPWADDFAAFDAYVKENLGPRLDGQSIDRIDNDQGYEPGNLRWADRFVQNTNRRSTVLIDFNGETLSVSQWARKIGVPRATLRARLFRYGWPVERALGFLAC